MIRPLLSIVIANYNYGRFLPDAIESVLSQSCPDYELIVIDGASTDDSVSVIRNYESKLSYWISEKDSGQSNAFNKGFARARGRFVTWLNVDDVMLPGTIARLKKASGQYPDCEWFVGGCFWLDKEMHVIQCRRAAPMSKIQVRAGQIVVWGPCSFFTKRMLDAVGGVDERFYYTMDSELWHKFAYLEHSRYRVMADYAWGLRLHEDAKMSGQNFDASQRDPSHPRWKKIAQEIEWMMVHYRPKHGMSRLTRLLSVSWLRAIASRLDTLRYRGKTYSEICARGRFS